MNEIENTKYILKDMLYGNTNTQKKDDISLTGQELQEALKLILNNEKLNDSEKKYFIENTWRIHYNVRPPTVDEFLTPKWIGAIADGLYPQVRETFKAFFHPYSGKRVLALSTAIGWGKSSLATLIVVYIIVHLQYMKNPKEFFNLNEMGSIVIALLSFTMKKVNQILLTPFTNVLRSSPMFERVRHEDRLLLKQEEIGKYKIAYTSAGRMGAFQFSKDIHIAVMSDRSALLGMNIIAGVASEISFWIEKGVSVEEIWGTFSDLRERINSRFHHRYLTATILDSSPLDLSLSPIDKWLYTPGEADADPEVMFVNEKHWEVFPEKYPIWSKTKETFPVYRGSAAKPPKVISKKEINNYGKEEVFAVPIDLELAFQNNTKKMVADYAAWPAGGIAKLIDNFDYIDGIFDDRLQNIYTYITASSIKDPERLIWDQIKDLFFIKAGETYNFYRAPKARRAIHIDLAESGDMASLSMTHLETGVPSGKLFLVNDFTLAISPEKSKINLDAVASFITDLKVLGRITLYKVTADQYQSSAMLQRLDRLGINVGKLSVDRETSPYRTVSSWMFSEKVKVGRNIFLKNNFKSLVETRTDSGKTKIDHSKGKIVYEDGADWVKSFMGVNAKDISDSFTGSAYTLITELNKKIPFYTWDELYDPNDFKDVSYQTKKHIKKKFIGATLNKDESSNLQDIMF